MDISLQSITKPVVHFLHRFHVTIFVIVALGSLAASIFLLNSIVNSSADSNGYVSTGNNASFDRATIDKINQLKTHDESTTSSIPETGRINPFVE